MTAHLFLTKRHRTQARADRKPVGRVADTLLPRENMMFGPAGQLQSRLVELCRAGGRTVRRLRSFLVLLGGAICHWLAASAVAAEPGYQEAARPFLEQHCLECHGAKKAKAGYRIDLLGTDFAAASVAEQWKEVIDRINAGEMPPEGKPRPDAEAGGGVVELGQRAVARGRARGEERRRAHPDAAAQSRRVRQHRPRPAQARREDRPAADGGTAGRRQGRGVRPARRGPVLRPDADRAQPGRGGEDRGAGHRHRAAEDEPHGQHSSSFLRRARRRTWSRCFPASRTRSRAARRTASSSPTYIEYIQGYPTYRTRVRRLGRDRSFRHQRRRDAGRLLPRSHQGQGGQPRAHRDRTSSDCNTAWIRRSRSRAR